MWSCDSTNLGPILDVLNGDFPEADVKRMSLNGLEKLVFGLVQHTTVHATKKPKWWPTGVVFNGNPDLGLKDEGEVKLALKQLVVNCSRFFRDRLNDNGTKWTSDSNDENCKNGKRSCVETSLERSLKRCGPVVPLPRLSFEPYVRLEKRKELNAFKDQPTKSQFLYYFRLNRKLSQIAHTTKVPTYGSTVKLNSCIHIPFSSDVGRILAAREQHYMPEDLKLKRLERSEWYTNKGVIKVTEEYKFNFSKEQNYTHNYKMPKRQFHQKRHSFHSSEFLSKFWTPLVVNLQQIDLEKLKKTRNQQKKKLVVVINKYEKMCCDIKSVKNRVRVSQRLKKNNCKP